MHNSDLEETKQHTVQGWLAGPTLRLSVGFARPASGWAAAWARVGWRPPGALSLQMSRRGPRGTDSQEPPVTHIYTQAVTRTSKAAPVPAAPDRPEPRRARGEPCPLLAFGGTTASVALPSRCGRVPVTVPTHPEAGAAARSVTHSSRSLRTPEQSRARGWARPPSLGQCQAALASASPCGTGGK